jgi:hypothetical protein
VLDAEGAVDFAATFAAAAPLVEAGVTDVRFSAIPLSDDFDADVEIYTGVVKAFRAALT